MPGVRLRRLVTMGAVSADVAPQGQPAGYKITIWCSFDGPEYDLAMALEQGELWEKASDVQYQIDPARG